MSPRFLAGAALIGALVVLQPYRPYVVEGLSMSPTLSNGQILVGKIRPDRVARGDVVVFRKGDETMIKRVAYLPDDRLEQFYIAGQWRAAPNRLSYRTLVSHHYRRRDLVIPQGSLYVIGDNSDVSVDSRSYGPIDMADLIAVIPGKQSLAISPFAGIHESAQAVASL